jgi:predicted aconitase/predicted aconitase with swiveling domain
VRTCARGSTVRATQTSSLLGTHSLNAQSLLERYAALTGARRLIPITRAHIDGCLYHGPASLDFARTMAESGAQVSVPTTLNVGAIDLLHPELFRGSAEVAAAGREMMRHYKAMGCRQTWTCAPYQLADRPGLGEQIAWAESNAIVFANSVLGARTERYGDFIDLCAAVTGLVPDVGLHTDEGRLATLQVTVEGLAERALASDVLFATLGHLIGQLATGEIPVVDGIPAASEDQLKAFGAAAASSGAVAMFHMVGVTPEAPTLRDALGGRAPTRTIRVRPGDLAQAAATLTSTRSLALGAVSLGTPHFSYAEFSRLRALLDGRRVHPALECFVSTGRDTLARVDGEGWGDALRASGVRMVTDTCTYLTPILSGRPGAVMTNSAKWAWYAPNNLGYEVVFGSLEECVESAVRGSVWRDASLWEAPGTRHAGAVAPTPNDDGPAAGAAGDRSSAAPIAPSGAAGTDAPSSPDIAGHAEGEVLALDDALSFWGGVHESSGDIIDTHHPQHGARVTGRILLMPRGRGSSSSSSVLAELIRNGSAPAAILLGAPDPILALGAMVAEALYGRTTPMATLDAATYARVRTMASAHLVVASDGVTVDGEAHA